MSLFVTIVLDGVGIGAQPDAGDYGDAGSHTLAHVCAAAQPRLPNLERLGLGCIVPLLCYGGPASDVGLRSSFNDHAASVAAFFKADFQTRGTSFLVAGGR